MVGQVAAEEPPAQRRPSRVGYGATRALDGVAGDEPARRRPRRLGASRAAATSPRRPNRLHAAVGGERGGADRRGRTGRGSPAHVAERTRCGPVSGASFIADANARRRVEAVAGCSSAEPRNGCRHAARRGSGRCPTPARHSGSTSRRTVSESVRRRGCGRVDQHRVLVLAAGDDRDHGRVRRHGLDAAVAGGGARSAAHRAARRPPRGSIAVGCPAGSHVTHCCARDVCHPVRVCVCVSRVHDGSAGTPAILGVAPTRSTAYLLDRCGTGARAHGGSRW